MTTITDVRHHLAVAATCHAEGTQQAVELDAARKHIPYLPQAEKAQARRELKATMKALGYYA